MRQRGNAMKKALLWLAQFIVFSCLTFSETVFVYKAILMHTHERITTWLGILIGSLLTAVIHFALLRLLNRKAKLQLNTGIVYVLSTAAAAGLCFLAGLRFDRHDLMKPVDFNKEVDYLILFLFSLWPVGWSAVISILAGKQKPHKAADES